MFLAGKVEETPRPLKDVILVSYEIIHRKDPAAAQKIKHKEVVLKLIDWVSKCHEMNEETVELLLKTILSADTSVSLRIHGDCLLQIVRTLRMEAHSAVAPIQPIVVAKLMEPAEKTDADGNMIMFVQGFITMIMQDINGVVRALCKLSMKTPLKEALADPRLM
ncbi:hypothetical protein POM88_029050 [Heracleum sosnowskyi]|uniref:Uncharacterized protein n=1 Tax=Heracleum sosnowskyi TaxID=360622 RepID=A0AAD8MHE1_9APIA|nr:hypothetical protein POM88_029050 [Heracleum sosnowskyi]